MNRILHAPEFGIVTFSFLLHFVWEFLQVPAFAGMAQMPHWEGIKLCTAATLGDVAFALVAFWTTSLAARSRHWFLHPAWRDLALFLGVGIVLTIGFEHFYTSTSLRWIYSDIMPRLPILGTGLSPMLQWIIVPLLVLWFLRRQTLTG